MRSNAVGLVGVAIHCLVLSLASSASAQGSCPPPTGFRIDDFALIEVSPSIRGLSEGNRECAVVFECSDPQPNIRFLTEDGPLPQEFTGHKHGDAGRPTGRLTPGAGNVTFTADQASGQIAGIIDCDEALGGALTVTFVTTEPRLGSPFAELRNPGPFTLTGNNGRHDDVNHFGKPQLVEKVRMLAEMYAQAFPNAPRLRINDMSLPAGGIFDFRTNWSTPHKSHRKGIDVDIGVVSRVQVLRLDRLATQLGLELKVERMENAQGEPLLDPDGNPRPDHYHLRLE